MVFTKLYSAAASSRSTMGTFANASPVVGTYAIMMPSTAKNPGIGACHGLISRLRPSPRNWPRTTTNAPRTIDAREPIQRTKYGEIVAPMNPPMPKTPMTRPAVSTCHPSKSSSMTGDSVVCANSTIPKHAIASVDSAKFRSAKSRSGRILFLTMSPRTTNAAPASAATANSMTMSFDESQSCSSP